MFKKSNDNIIKMIENTLLTDYLTETGFQSDISEWGRGYAWGLLDTLSMLRGSKDSDSEFNRLTNIIREARKQDLQGYYEFYI